MDHDQIITAVARLETVADRFETIANTQQDHASRIQSLESTRSTWRSIGKWCATVGGVVVAAALVLFFGLH